jgi:hypothetical protein
VGRGVVLTYHIRKRTLAKASQYSVPRDAMRSATEEWMEICGIEFQHVVENDANESARKKSPTSILCAVPRCGRRVHWQRHFFPTIRRSGEWY